MRGLAFTVCVNVLTLNVHFWRFLNGSFLSFLTSALRTTLPLRVSTLRVELQKPFSSHRATGASPPVIQPDRRRPHALHHSQSRFSVDWLPPGFAARLPASSPAVAAFSEALRRLFSRRDDKYSKTFSICLLRADRKSDVTWFYTF